MIKLLSIILLIICISGCQTNNSNIEDKETDAEVTQVNQDSSEDAHQTVKEETIKACSKEAKLCPDGNTVGRDPYNNCEFTACKISSKIKSNVMCTADVKKCPDGSFVSRNHKNSCKFRNCPETVD